MEALQQQSCCLYEDEAGIGVLASYIHYSEDEHKLRGIILVSCFCEASLGTKQKNIRG